MHNEILMKARCSDIHLETVFGLYALYSFLVFYVRTLSLKLLILIYLSRCIFKFLFMYSVLF